MYWIFVRILLSPSHYASRFNMSAIRARRELYVYSTRDVKFLG
jgi:hypothetical protein